MTVPGVFDMRTDGSGEKAELPRRPFPTERRGFEGILQGHGAKVVGDKVVIQDRAYWVIGAIPAVNGDIAAAFDDVAKAAPGGLRNVHIGEQYMLMDWGITFVSRILFAPASWVTPPFTFIASGTPLRGDRRDATEPSYGTPSAPIPPRPAAPPPTAPPAPSATPAPAPPALAPPARPPSNDDDDVLSSDPLELPSDSLPPPDELSPDEFGVAADDSGGMR